MSYEERHILNGKTLLHIGYYSGELDKDYEETIFPDKVEGDYYFFNRQYGTPLLLADKDDYILVKYIQLKLPKES